MSTQVLLVSDQPVYRDEPRARSATRRSSSSPARPRTPSRRSSSCACSSPKSCCSTWACRKHSTSRARSRRARGGHVVALAIREEDSEVIACAEVGIVGYVPRNGSVRDAVDAISAAARGEAHCSPRIVGSLLRQHRRAHGRAAKQRARRRAGRAHGARSRVLALLQQGLPGKLISGAWGSELATVKNHVHSIFGKLGLRRRAEDRGARAHSGSQERRRRR